MHHRAASERSPVATMLALVKVIILIITTKYFPNFFS